MINFFEFMNGGTNKFNPLLCESYKNLSLCKDNDLDVNFYLENISCEYCSIV